MPASPVEFVHPDVEAKLDAWARIRAAIGGEEAIKKLGDKILPRPNAADVTPANRARFDSYLARAVWYNVSGRTLQGLTGYVFAKEPVVKLPSLLATVETNVDGSGVTLAQQAKEALRLVLAFGRGGLLVDYPSVSSATSRQQLLDGNVSPTMVLYEPEQVTNWRTSYIGSKVMLDLIVLRENYVEPSTNEFEVATSVQYRVLVRNEEGVEGRIYRKVKGSDDYTVVETYHPKNKGGNPLRVIPFTFLGSVNNDSYVDPAPLEDLVSLNIAHFRNSADHEEACYLVGQPTPWVSGLTKQWVEEVMGGALHLGSRAVLPLPVGGQAGLLQVTANTMPFEAMKHKEAQMVALGAKLVEQSTVQQTATEVGLHHASEVSTLTAAATNVFLAYRTAMEFAGEFVGAETATVEFDLTEPLTRDIVTPEQANAITAMWQGGLIDFEEARYALKKAGLAWKDDEEVQEAAAAEGLPARPEDKPEPTEEE